MLKTILSTLLSRDDLLSFKFGGFVIGIDCPSESVDGHQAEEALHKGKV